MYLVKTPWWLKAFYASYVWHIQTDTKTIYLTFDDGPHETATPFVLDQLKQYNAKATFFCIGKNVLAHPNIYQRILIEGHAVGNHTQNHLNGWKTSNDVYLKDIAEAATVIDSNLFRPPYGRIRKPQARALKSQIKNSKFQVIMWDILSGDFDTAISPDKCLSNVLQHTKAGSIIVFHDSTKAWERMHFALPKVLEHFSKMGYAFKAIEL
jgi:peptidoglycan/xylan/chitin deacetylase (PgdA/CDA1 family)